MPFLGMPLELHVPAKLNTEPGAAPPIGFENARLLLRFRPAVFVRDEHDRNHDTIVGWPPETFKDHPEPIFAAYASQLSVDPAELDSHGGLPAISTKYWSLKYFNHEADTNIELVALTFRGAELTKTLFPDLGKAGLEEASAADIDKFSSERLKESITKLEQNLADSPSDGDGRRLRLGELRKELQRGPRCRLEERRKALLSEEPKLARNMFRALLEQSLVQLHLNLDGTMRNRGMLFVKLVCDYR